MTFLLLVLLILACYRLARLISQDLITEFIRNWFGRQAATGRPAWQFLAELVHCPYCTGVWMAAVLALSVSHTFLEWCLYTLAIAGGQSFLQNLNDK
jgi:hypothetical protein